ncbi:MAG: MFS transporter, partial [Pseudomonadota bacterium]
MSTWAFIRQNAPFLAAGVLLTFLSSFGQTFFISIFAGEIRTAFDLSHGGWGTAYSLGTFASAIVMIWVGVLTDRFRVRTLGLFALLLLAGAATTMALAPNLATLIIAVFLLRLGGQGLATHLAAVAMARWYVATRGRALSIAYLGVAAGEAFLPMIVVAAMAGVDWRALWGVAAVIILGLIPVLMRLLRLERTPAAIARETQNAGIGGRHWTRRDLLTNRLFWFVLPYLLGPPAFSTAFFFHQVHLAEFKGWGHVVKEKSRAEGGRTQKVRHDEQEQPVGQQVA